MSRMKLFSGGSALAVAVTLFAPHAFAATDTASTDVSADTGATVAEIEVVATKREEKLETVPVAITAFTARQRDVLGIRTVQEVSDFTPGLSYFAAADVARIRGIGRNTVNLATAAGVA